MSKKSKSHLKKIQLKTVLENIFPIIFLSSLLLFWLWLGISNFNLNADVSRDLSELSNLWIKKIVWLGPHLRVGFPASPIYFYLLMPGLILSGGSAYSLVASQVTLAITSFIALIYFSKRKLQPGTYLSLLFIGFSNWWITSTIKPWNGNMYVLWIMLALVMVWHKKRLWLSIFLFGIAVAIHPAALLVSPIFIYETLIYKSLSLIRKIIYFIGGMLLPWAPIIAFEFITKGYLTREWLIHRDTGMSLVTSSANLKGLFSMIGIPQLLLSVILIWSVIKSSTRVKKWYLLTIPALIFLNYISTLHQYYLLGVAALIFFLIIQTLSKNLIGKILLIIVIVIFAQNIKNKYSFDLSQPINNRLENIINVIKTIEKNKQLTTESTYALISVIDNQNSTPQADDYRFVLRTRGYKATNIDEYPTSNYLFIFFENNQSDPEGWNDWHSNYFGDKELISSQVINGTQVLIYKRK